MENRIVYLSISDVKTLNDDYYKSIFPLRYEKSLKFKFEEDKFRSLAAGYLLAKELGIKENEIKFNENGKPFAKDKPNFNLSHSGNYAVLAVSDKLIGVDIEKIDSSNINTSIDVFTKDELIYLQEDKAHRFFTLWTLKEAALKAIGKGMSVNLNSFSVLPLIEGKNIELDGKTLYGNTYTFDDCVLSIVSEINEEPNIHRIYPN